MFGFNTLTIVAVASSAIIIVFLSFGFYAYKTGQSTERAATVQNSLESLRERAKTDDRIKAMPDSDLCASIGGMWKNGTCQ